MVVAVQEGARVHFKCRAGPSPEVDVEEHKKGSPLRGISTSTWSAGLASLGFLETGYLTYLKLSNSEAFCPVGDGGGGGSCGDVLNSVYSAVFGTATYCPNFILIVVDVGEA